MRLHTCRTKLQDLERMKTWRRGYVSYRFLVFGEPLACNRVCCIEDQNVHTSKLLHCFLHDSLTVFLARDVSHHHVYVGGVLLAKVLGLSQFVFTASSNHQSGRKEGGEKKGGERLVLLPLELSICLSPSFTTSQLLITYCIVAGWW